MGEPDQRLSRSEHIASDAVGRLIEFWGFRRNMGRIWAVLYLAEGPLGARELQERLQLSSGAVSMTVKELARWGVVRKVWIEGERRDHFEAEVDFWRMISRVFRERELVEVEEAIRSLEAALDHAEEEGRSGDLASRRRARLRVGRLRQLLDLARLGRRLLTTVLSDARVDASALARVLLGHRRKPSSGR
ncbi:MAG: GbsR/MarR family transcriptional regulator [Sandaracinaceae bacterium]